MGYRKRGNRHDSWMEFRHTHQTAIERTALPSLLFESEDLLITFMSNGTLEGVDVDLRRIPDEQFGRLEEVINAYFHDGWEQASWTVLRAERLRRFKRYG